MPIQQFMCLLKLFLEMRILFDQIELYFSSSSIRSSDFTYATHQPVLVILSLATKGQEHTLILLRKLLFDSETVAEARAAYADGGL